MGIVVPQDQVVLLLGIYLKDASLYYKGTCSTMFIITLFVIARNWKQPTCPSTEKKWIKEMWHIYSAIINIDVIKFAGKWIELENLKDTHGVYSLISGHYP